MLERSGRVSEVGAVGADRIFLRDHVAEIEIGAYAEEFGRRQALRFSVELDVQPFAPDAPDEEGSVVSYDLILGAIRDLAAGPRMKLLETFAARLAARLLAHRGVLAARIRIEKLDRTSGALGVEIERRALR